MIKKRRTNVMYATPHMEVVELNAGLRLLSGSDELEQGEQGEPWT